ncbi:MAG: S-layer homology domain-containing protein [Ruminococcaceae bacterium]|nr:S-layer homology domain-containing protein [Oscillospiraceae bacterium]
MKKIFSVVIALSLVLATFCISPVSYADESYSEKAIEVVAKLGLMEGRLTYSPDIEITRGDLIASVLNLCPSESQAGNSVFTDLEKDHPNFTAIMTAYNMGLVAGFGDGTVRPDDAATVSQAMKLIYYALGYKEFLSQVTSPAQAVETANVGTFSDTNSSKILTSGKLADLLVQAGESYPLEAQQITKDGNATFKYYTAKETVLERYYDIVRVEGVVTSAGGMNLIAGQSYNSDWIVIAGTVLKKDAVSADSFFGQRVVAYYRQHSDMKDKRLVCLYSYNNTVHEISAEDYDGYTDGKLYYEVGDMEYEDIDLSFSSADMFVNNVLVANPEESYFDINSGKITLIDNNLDKKIDVIIVVEYETYVVESVNASLNAIFGKYNDEALLLNEYTNVSMLDENGNVIYLEGLSPNDVLSVVKAGDKSNISLVYAFTELRGTIEETRESNGKFYVTIDGKEYRVTDDCYHYEGSFLTVGRVGLFPLNTAGEVATYRSYGELARFGYIIQTKQTPGMTSTVMSKILDQNGEVVIYEYGKNVKIDGKVRNSVDATQLLNGVLVSYTVSDGIMKTVDTPFKKVSNGTNVTYEGLGEDESHLNSLQLYFDGYEEGKVKEKYKGTSGILGGMVALDKSAPIFVIPVGDAVQDSDYKAYPTSQYLRHDGDYQLVAYKMKDRSLIASATVEYTTPAGANETVNPDTSPVIVETARKVLDPNGDPATKIVGYQQQSKVELYLTEELEREIKHTIHSGDIIKVSYTKENYIKGIEVLYCYETRSMVGANPSAEKTALFRVMQANVYKRVDDMIISTTQELVPGTDYEGKEIANEELRNLSTYTLLKYDERTQTVSKASVTDVVSFEDTGSICSELVVYDRYGDPRYIYVFNDPKD